MPMDRAAGACRPGCGRRHGAAGHGAAYRSNLMPWASGRASDQLMVLVWRRMYTFQASEPDSRPPPVSFSPPKAPPISAPEVPMLTLAMPQSLPDADRKRSATVRFWVAIAEDRACGTPLCISMASSRVEYFITHRIGEKVSCWTTSPLFFRPVLMVGST